MKNLRALMILSLGLFLACSKSKNAPEDSGFEYPSDTTTAEHEVKVMSFNIRYCTPYLPIGNTAIDIEGTASVIKNANPDVALLQEVDVNTDRSSKLDEIALISAYTGMKYYYFSKAIDYQGGSFGVAILSKYPIDYSKTHLLPKQAVDGSYVEQRVLCETRITFPGNHTITVATSHLDLTETNRLLQVTAINDVLSNSTYPVIFGGDFNASPGSATINKIDGFGYVRTCLKDCYSIPSTNPDKEIDYVTVLPANKFDVLSHRVITGVTASDHLPLMTVLKMN